MNIDWKLAAAVAWIVISLVTILVQTWPMGAIIYGAIAWAATTAASIMYILVKWMRF